MITTLIEQFVSITGDAQVDKILFWIIAWISFSVAFGLVGIIFDILGMHDSDVMSDTHLVIRIIVFIFLTWAFVQIIRFVAWLISFEWWVYCIGVFLISAIIFLVHLIKYKSGKSKSEKWKVEKQQSPTKGTKDAQTNIPQTKQTIKGCCPRCHSKLVKRHGPYGGFWGCTAYAKTKCRYTRKYI